MGNVTIIRGERDCGIFLVRKGYTYNIIRKAVHNLTQFEEEE